MNDGRSKCLLNSSESGLRYVATNILVLLQQRPATLFLQRHGLATQNIVLH